jgi:hypothetical protein
MARRTVVRRKATGSVTARTAARRAARRQTETIQVRAARRVGGDEPESVTQARTWDRKYRRYLVAGLCHPCAAKASWGHSLGFQKIDDPCAKCQPIVNQFATPGPEGSKWRKVLDKLERSVTREEMEALL